MSYLLIGVLYEGTPGTPDEREYLTVSEATPNLGNGPDTEVELFRVPLKSTGLTREIVVECDEFKVAATASGNVRIQL